MVVPEVYSEINSGILFKKMEDSLISDNSWKIILDFDISELKKELEPLHVAFKNMERLLKDSVNVWDEDPDSDFIRLKSNLDAYKQDLDDLFMLLPFQDIAEHRSKRGLINVGGYVLKWLFGVPTDEDLNLVNDRINELKHVTSNVVHSRLDQLTLVKDLNYKVKTNTKAIVEIMSKLTSSHMELGASLLDYSKDYGISHQSLLKHMKVTSISRHLGQAIDEAKLRIVEFRQALELVSTGRISSKLLPPHDLIRILETIEKTIPDHLKLPIPVTEKELFLYYNFCTAKALASPLGIKLIVTVPLSSDSGKFETYKILSVPLYQYSVKHWLKWETPFDYLLISRDRQYFVPLTKDDFSQCRQNLFFLCPSSIKVFHHTVNDCMYSLFMGMDTAHLKCTRKLTDQVTSPFLVQIDHNWIYSVSEPCKLVLNCLRESYNVISNEPHFEKSYSELVLNGSGILHNVSNCDMFSKEIRVFSKIKCNSFYKRNVTSIHLPGIDTMLTLNESKLLLANNKLTFETLDSIKRNLDDNRDDVKLEQLLNSLNVQLDDENMLYSHKFSLILCLVLALGFLSICILLGVFVCRRKLRNCCARDTPPHTQSTGPTVRANEGSPLAEIIQETSFARFQSPEPN